MLNKFNFFAIQMRKLLESLHLDFRNTAVFPRTLAPPEFRVSQEQIAFSNGGPASFHFDPPSLLFDFNGCMRRGGKPLKGFNFSISHSFRT